MGTKNRHTGDLGEHTQGLSFRKVAYSLHDVTSEMMRAGNI
jgi:hypothetical protein